MSLRADAELRTIGMKTIMDKRNKKLRVKEKDVIYKDEKYATERKINQINGDKEAENEKKNWNYGRRRCKKKKKIKLKKNKQKQNDKKNTNKKSDNLKMEKKEKMKQV